MVSLYRARPCLVPTRRLVVLSEPVGASALRCHIVLLNRLFSSSWPLSLSLSLSLSRLCLSGAALTCASADVSTGDIDRCSFPLFPYHSPCHIIPIQVKRVGPMHQAGSDSLLTAAVFFKMKQVQCKSLIEGEGFGFHVIRVRVCVCVCAWLRCLMAVISCTIGPHLASNGQDCERLFEVTSRHLTFLTTHIILPLFMCPPAPP